MTIPSPLSVADWISERSEHLALPTVLRYLLQGLLDLLSCAAQLHTSDRVDALKAWNMPHICSNDKSLRSRNVCFSSIIHVLHLGGDVFPHAARLKRKELSGKQWGRHRGRIRVWHNTNKQAHRYSLILGCDHK